MINEQKGFQQEIINLPKDDLCIRVYCDWLEDNNYTQEKINFFRGFADAFAKGRKFHHLRRKIIPWSYVVVINNSIYIIYKDNIIINNIQEYIRFIAKCHHTKKETDKFIHDITKTGSWIEF